MAQKILIALTESSLQEALREHFEKEGAKVFASPDGTHASFLASHETVDIAILDAKLPGMSGLQVAAVMRSSKNNSKVALYVLTPEGDEAAVARAKQIGGIKVFQRPVSMDGILEGIAAKNKAQTNAFDVRILNCFIDAVKEVMTFYFNHPPDMGKPMLKTDRKAMGYVSSLISINSQKVQGSVSITCSRPFLNILADKVFQGQSVTLDDTGIADLTGEMCNQVTGKVKLNLAKIGLAIRIGLPKVVVGVDHVVIHSSQSPVICLPITVQGQACAIEFSLTEGAEGAIEEEKAEAPPPDMILF